MKDEVLQKALEADVSVIPRYNIISPDGTLVAENVQLVLKNEILTEGTPLNRQSLLKDTTAVAYGLSAESALPDDVLLAIRNSAGYCPKLKIYSIPGATIYMQDVHEPGINTSHVVPASGVLSVDILRYGTYRICGNIAGTYIGYKHVEINEIKQYSVELFNYAVYVKFTVDTEVGATILATHADGSVASGVVGNDKTGTVVLYKEGTWSIVLSYNGGTSKTITYQATSTANGTTAEYTPSWLLWTKVQVNTTSGATVTLSKSGVKKIAISINGSAIFWMSGTVSESWSVSASLNGKNGGGMVTTTLQSTKTVTITLT